MCAFIVVIATSPVISAAELFGIADGNVHWGGINVFCDLQHYDTGQQDDVDPEWEWNDQTQMWEMDWTPNPPAIIPIESDMIINDVCDPVLTMEVSIKCELTVVKINNPPQAWDDFWTSPGFPNPVTFDGSGMPPKYQEYLGPINVVGNRGNDYTITVSLSIWDHATNPPTLYHDDVVGVIYT